MRNVTVVVWFGAWWGFIEATLGFLLHLMPRLVPAFPRLAGVVLFPIGVLFMTRAMRATNWRGAALAVAVVAAVVKLASGALPAVQFAFIRGPILAIVAEGLIVTAVVGAVGLRAGKLLPLTAYTLSFGWRALFLGANLALGIRGGILMRPAADIMRYLWVDSLWNAGVIVAAVLLWTALRAAPRSRRVADGNGVRPWIERLRETQATRDWASRPAFAFAALVLAVAGEMLTQLL